MQQHHHVVAQVYIDCVAVLYLVQATLRVFQSGADQNSGQSSCFVSWCGYKFVQ